MKKIKASIDHSDIRRRILATSVMTVDLEVSLSLTPRVEYEGPNDLKEGAHGLRRHLPVPRMPPAFPLQRSHCWYNETRHVHGSALHSISASLLFRDSVPHVGTIATTLYCRRVIVYRFVYPSSEPTIRFNRPGNEISRIITELSEYFRHEHAISMVRFCKGIETISYEKLP